MSRLFDPVTLVNENLEANATRRDPLPVGEVVGQIMEISFSDGISKPGSKNPGQPWTRLDAKVEITDQEYLSQIPGAPEKATTTVGVMLDMQNGSIAVGPNKNIRLGRLREAAGVNGKPLNMLVGQFLRLQISHKPHPTEPDVVLDEVSGYTKV